MSTPPGTPKTTAGPSFSKDDHQQSSDGAKEKYSFAHQAVKDFSAYRRKQPATIKFIDRAQRSQVRAKANPHLYNLHHEAQVLMDEFLSWIKEHESSTAPVTLTQGVLTDIYDACPSFDFVWTDEYILGEGVPPSDDSKLESCDCNEDDGCDPATCKCFQKSLRLAPTHYDDNDFAYDANGHVRNVNVDGIWECNKNCTCPPTCRNRVVQKGRQVEIDIYKDELFGWGVRARENLFPGAFIGIYAGELVTNEEADRRNLIYDTMATTYVFDLDGEIPKKAVLDELLELDPLVDEHGRKMQFKDDEYPKLRCLVEDRISATAMVVELENELINAIERAKSESRWTPQWEGEQRAKLDAWKKRARADGHPFLILPEQEQVQARRHEEHHWRLTRSKQLSVDGSLCGNFTRFFNHSCEPNLSINPVWINESSPYRPYYAFFTNAKVPKGTPLTFDYASQDAGENEEKVPAGPQKLAWQRKPNLFDEEDKDTLAIHRMVCRCGSANCRGWVFKR